MKRILLIATLFTALTANKLFAQFDELRILYADGKYEKMIKLADKMASDDKYKKDPMVHFWLSKGLYKMSQSGSANDLYKNSYKESINALGKFVRTDKDGSALLEDENKEFFDDIQNSLVEQISNEISTGNFRKASSWVLSYKKITKNPVGQMFLEGTCKFRADDKSGALVLWRTADAELDKNPELNNFTDADKEMLKLGLEHTAEGYVALRQVDKAKALLNKGMKWFDEDPEYKEVYNKIAR